MRLYPGMTKTTVGDVRRSQHFFYRGRLCFWTGIDNLDEDEGGRICKHVWGDNTRQTFTLPEYTEVILYQNTQLRGNSWRMAYATSGIFAAQGDRESDPDKAHGYYLAAIKALDGPVRG